MKTQSDQRSTRPAMRSPFGCSTFRRSLAAAVLLTWSARPASVHADDHGTNFNNATTIAVGSITHGVIESLADSDYFKFVVADSARYVLFSRGVSGTAFFTARLYDASYSSLANDTGGGEGDNFRIERTLSPGTYYLEVQTTAGVVLPEYDIHVEGPGAPTATDEGGYSCWSAATTSVGTVKSGVIDQEGDRDFLTFTIASTAKYVIFSRGVSGTVFFSARLYDAAYNTLDNDTGGGEGDNFRIERTLSPGTYCLEVRTTAGTVFPTYDIHIEGPGSPTATDEHGASCWSATTTAVGSVTGGTLNEEGDRDFLTFTIASTAKYVIFSRGVSGTPYFSGRIYDAAYNSIVSDTGDGEGDNFRIERTLGPGTYYLEVRVTAGLVFPTYDIHIEGPGAPTTTDEHGFSCWSASAAEVNSITPGLVDQEGDRDFVRFVAPTSGTYTIYSRGVSGTAYFRGALYDSDYASVASNTGGGDGDNFLISRALNAGTYYVEVQVTAGTVYPSYEVVIAGPGAAGSATLVAIEIVEGMPSVSVSNASPAWTAWLQRSDSMVNQNWTSIVPVSATFATWRDLAISTTWTSAFYRLVQESLTP